MWFGYVPQIKNTNVISARGLHFSRSPSDSSPPSRIFFFLVANVSPFPTTNLSAVLSYRYPTDVSAFRVLVEIDHLHMYMCALAYKLLFSENEERE